MANYLPQILAQWFELKDQTEWVLGTVFDTVGSSYRKAGAMMMFSGLGHQLGLLSGGCLEADIQRHARRVMLTQTSTVLTYDGNDEDDISFQLGIGCGGVVRIILQPVTQDNNYLDLGALHFALAERKKGHYSVDLSPNVTSFTNQFAIDDINKSTNIVRNICKNPHRLNIATTPLNHLLIVGGGVDARPLAHMASLIGWQVSVWDPRPANGRREFFETADFLIGESRERLESHINAHPIDAAVIMSHSVSLDAQALTILTKKNPRNPPKYIALLGPTHRRAEVIEKSGVSSTLNSTVFAGPAGLDLGGELPESIALSILSECQAVIYGRTAASLSLQLSPQPENKKYCIP